MSWLRTEGGAFWAVFVMAFLGVAVWESLRPRRELSEPVERRWGKHSLLLLASFVITAVLVPMSPMLMAASVAGSRYGLLNKPWLPLAARWILAVLILDITKYAAHRALHSVYFLWRVHQIHHSDRDFDVSTSVRAHPIEVILFRGASLAAIAILAPPLGAVLVAELMSVFESFFGHANASLPEWLQRVLGVFFYTADTHRIHHSVDVRMQNSNFGDIFPWWDRIFGTYLPPLPVGEDRIVTGLEEFQGGDRPGFAFLLKQPFLRNPYGQSGRPSA
jgi:sterol desaturase/sphingolipid hydroxylase (fatty acid hydroxylase superfamily)